MPDEQPRPKRRLKAPSPRRFAAGAAASFVAVFGVLALRVHDGDDPALQAVSPVTKSATTASQTATTTTTPEATSSASDDSSSSDSSGAVSTTPSPSTSAS